jgi:protein involved in polysaccharide export with SLBB domain
MNFHQSNFKRLFICLFFAVACWWAMSSYAQNAPPPPLVIEQTVQTTTTENAEAVPLSAEVSPEPQAAAPSFPGYRIGPDDEIKITVYGEEDLSGSYPVSGTGNISMPLIGDVHVQNFTLKDVELAVTEKLKDGYLLDPKVSVEISKYRPFYILGEVRVPGSYPYVNNMSVLNAVAVAGGFTYRANKKRVEIMRTHEEDADVDKDQPVDTLVVPGDIILVKERFF